MATKYYVNNSGVYLGGFDGNTFKVPASAIEVPLAPQDARSLWNGSSWSQPVLTVEEKEVKAGVTIETLVEALYEKVANNDSTALDALKVKKDDAKK